MVQGAIKKPNKASLLSKKSGRQTTSRVTKPKKAKVTTSADKLAKKYSAGLVEKTERLLGERAGHLELIGGKGKKNAEQGKKGSGKKDEKTTVKGGTRKFG